MGRIMKEIVNEYRESLLESHKSDNTVYAYVTDVNLYIKYLNSKDIYLDETDNTPELSAERKRVCTCTIYKNLSYNKI